MQPSVPHAVLDARGIVAAADKDIWEPAYNSSSGASVRAPHRHRVECSNWMGFCPPAIVQTPALEADPYSALLSY